MPEDGAKLDDHLITAIERWIDLGAPYDKPLAGQQDALDWRTTTIDDSRRDFWCFRPLANVDPPAGSTSDWVVSSTMV